MENASQALIIAGAILLAILLIAVGMFIFNKANSAVQDSAGQMDQNAIQASKQKFESYQGKISGTQLKALISVWGQEIATYKAKDVPASSYISLTQLAGKGTHKLTGVKENEDSAAKILALRNQIQDLAQYEVAFAYYNTGLIKEIQVGKI